MKLRHVERLSQGNCGLEEGTVFNDLLNSLNRIATHCASSMVALIKIREKDTDIHIHDSKVYAIEGDDYKTVKNMILDKEKVVLLVWKMNKLNNVNKA